MKKLQLQNISIGYKTQNKSKVLVSGASLTLTPDKVTAILGKNGTGKSTLLNSILGLQTLLDGEISINSTSITNYNRKNLAKQISLVLPKQNHLENITANSFISLGRYPYSSLLGKENNTNHELIVNTKKVLGILHLDGRLLNTLSDGEAQKVAIARAIVQDTPFILLDEPTAFLDIPSKLEIMHLLRDISKKNKKGILFTTHDFELATPIADEFWIIHNNEIIDGLPEDLITNGKLQKVFEKNQIKLNPDKGHFELNYEGISTIPVNIKGSHTTGKGVWLKNALLKNGYKPSDNESEITISLNNECYTVYFADTKVECSSIQEVLIACKKISEH